MVGHRTILFLNSKNTGDFDPECPRPKLRNCTEPVLYLSFAYFVVLKVALHSVLLDLNIAPVELALALAHG